MTQIEFYAFAMEWQIGLMPFFNNKFTNYLDPLKQYQYSSLGMKIFSGNVLSMMNKPLTWVYKDSSDISKKFLECLNYIPTEKDLAEQKEFVKKHNWKKLIQTQLDYIYAK